MDNERLAARFKDSRVEADWFKETMMSALRFAAWESGSDVMNKLSNQAHGNADK